MFKPKSTLPSASLTPSTLYIPLHQRNYHPFLPSGISNYSIQLLGMSKPKVTAEKIFLGEIIHYRHQQFLFCTLYYAEVVSDKHINIGSDSSLAELTRPRYVCLGMLFRGWIALWSTLFIIVTPR
jgi:hypothetical protein